LKRSLAFKKEKEKTVKNVVIKKKTEMIWWSGRDERDGGW